MDRPDHHWDCLWKKGHLRVLPQGRKPAVERDHKDLPQLQLLRVRALIKAVKAALRPMGAFS